MKILAINGSPRRGGNTDILLDEFIRGAVCSGAAAEVLEASSLTIMPCHECLSCFHDGICVIKDDMIRVYDKISSADAFVLASPIFFYSVTGWSKALIDRAQALWARKYVLKDPALADKQKIGFFLSVGGTKGRNLFEGAILTVRYFFDALNARYEGELLFRQVDLKADILKVPGALTQAFSQGERFARLTH